jgi:hypothetical protein
MYQQNATIESDAPLRQHHPWHWPRNMLSEHHIRSAALRRGGAVAVLMSLGDTKTQLRWSTFSQRTLESPGNSTLPDNATFVEVSLVGFIFTTSQMMAL